MGTIMCTLGWHDWDKWGEPLEGHSKMNQFRECQNCGQLDHRSKYCDQVSTNSMKRPKDTAEMQDESS